MRPQGLADQPFQIEGMSFHSVSGMAELGQHSWLSVLYCLQRIVKINFERESLGSKRADSWGLLWRVALSSLVDYVQAGFAVAQRWPGLQAPCAEAGSTSSPLAGPGAWEPGGGWGGHLCGCFNHAGVCVGAHVPFSA